MVDVKTVHEQLKKIKFGSTPWNQAEVRELPHILHDHETIEECVNGLYEGGVALLVATDSRVLLIDKKPLNYLTVEDLRFDMINEIDYSHRLMNATITISTGSKTLRFSSLNQPRLRRLINAVQERMSLIKKEQNDKVEHQQQHLEEINRQLQMYLLAQHQQLQQQIAAQSAPAPQQQLDLPKPDPKLADYLFAQRLLDQFQRDHPESAPQPQSQPQAVEQTPQAAQVEQALPIQPQSDDQADMVHDARQEVFSKHVRPSADEQRSGQDSSGPMSFRASTQSDNQEATSYFKGLEINPLRIAYSKLPMMLRNRKFGRPSFHAHTQEKEAPTGRGAMPAPTR